MDKPEESHAHNPMKRGAGRPFKYEENEADKFEAAIIDYFDKIMNDLETYDLTGKLFKVNPTITGMMLHIGLSSKQSYYNYMKRESFKQAAERAKLAIESAYEAMLYEKGSAGAIFALKNFGWEDKSTIENAGEVQKVEINFT